MSTTVDIVAPAWWPADWVLGDAAHPRWHGGGCMALALALQDLTGWAIYQVNIHGPHYVVKTPEGFLLDHLGARAWPKSYRGRESETRAAVAKNARMWGPLQDYPDATLVAESLLRDYAACLPALLAA